MCVWTWVSGAAGAATRRKAVHRPAQVLVLLVGAERQALAQGGLVHLDGEVPARSRSRSSSWIASAICVQVSSRGWSSRTNDHCRIVTGPVSMAFIGRSVSDWA